MKPKTREEADIENWFNKYESLYDIMTPLQYCLLHIVSESRIKSEKEDFDWLSQISALSFNLFYFNEILHFKQISNNTVNIFKNGLTYIANETNNI